MKSAFALNMVKARKFYGWYQQKAADIINIKRPTLQAYEEGRAYPNYDTLFKICDVYRIADIRAFISDEKFDISRQQEKQHLPDSLVEKKYKKAPVKIRTAINILLEI